MNRPIYCLKRFWFLGFIVFGSLFVVNQPTRVYAAYDDLPQQLPTLKDVNSNDPDTHQYIHLSKYDNDVGDGDPGANLPISYIKFYIQNANKDGNRSFYINLVNRVRPDKYVCENYSIEWRVHSLDSGESLGPVIESGSIKANGCAANSNYPSYSGYPFSFSSKDLVKSEVPGHRNLATAVIRFRIVPDAAYVNSPMSATFSLKATSGGRLGYQASSQTYQTNTYSTVDAGGGNGAAGVNIYPSLSGTSDSTSRPGPYGTGPGDKKPQHTISQKFGVPCEYTGPSTITVRFRDADRGTSTQDNNLSVTVKRFGPSLTYLDTQNPAVTWTNGSGIGNFTMDVQPGYNYRIDFEDVEGGNALGLYYPFDSGDFNLNCPTPPTVSAACDTISFQLPTNSHGATRAYKVYFKSRGGASGAIGESSMTSSASKIADSTASEGTTVNIDVKNRYVSGYYEYMVRVYQGDNAGTGLDTDFDGDGIKYADVGPCYTATCTVKATSPTLGDGKVVAGERFYVEAAITNSGQNDIPSPRNYGGSNRNLSATLALDGKWTPDPNNGSSGGLSPIYPDLEGNSVAPGDTVYAGFYLTAPATVGTHDIRVYPDYWTLGSLSNGALCSGSGSTIPIYEPFKFSAPAVSRGFVPDPESPARIDFSTTVHKETGPDVNNTVRRTFTGKGASITPSSSNLPTTHTATYGGDQTYTDSYNIPAGYLLGDEYCMTSFIDRTEGYRGPGGVDDVILTVASTSSSTCDKVVNRPYVVSYGADVAAGCGPTSTSGILAFMRPISEQSAPANKAGSGAQLAAMAKGQISGFTSTSLRGAAPTAPRGLTFANDNPPVPDAAIQDPVLGGNMNSNGWCAPDYFNETQFSGPPQKSTLPSATPSIDVNAFADLKQTYIKPTSGKVRIIGGNNFSKHHAIYVEGDVFIRDNITYTTDYSGGIDTIPSFALIVKGNIYINQDVGQLDGFFVAQRDPARANTGRVYTCASGATDSPVIVQGALFTECGATGPKRQLTVNGAVVAERLVLNRTGYSLRDSTLHECAVVVPSTTCTVASKAAEIFNFSPEMYLSPPYFNPRSTFTSGDYQYLATLPPIL